MCGLNQMPTTQEKWLWVCFLGLFLWVCGCGFVVVVFFVGLFLGDLSYLSVFVGLLFSLFGTSTTNSTRPRSRKKRRGGEEGGEIPAHGFEPRTFCMLSRRDNQLHHAGCAGSFTFGSITTRSAELQSCPLSTFQRASPAGQCHLTLPLCAGIRPPSSELVRA